MVGEHADWPLRRPSPDAGAGIGPPTPIAAWQGPARLERPRRVRLLPPRAAPRRRTHPAASRPRPVNNPLRHRPRADVERRHPTPSTRAARSSRIGTAPDARLPSRKALRRLQARPSVEQGGALHEGQLVRRLGVLAVVWKGTIAFARAYEKDPPSRTSTRRRSRARALSSANPEARAGHALPRHFRSSSTATPSRSRGPTATEKNPPTYEIRVDTIGGDNTQPRHRRRDSESKPALARSASSRRACSRPRRTATCRVRTDRPAPAAGSGLCLNASGGSHGSASSSSAGIRVSPGGTDDGAPPRGGGCRSGRSRSGGSTPARFTLVNGPVDERRSQDFSWDLHNARTLGMSASSRSP